MGRKAHQREIGQATVEMPYEHMTHRRPPPHPQVSCCCRHASNVGQLGLGRQCRIHRDAHGKVQRKRGCALRPISRDRCASSSAISAVTGQRRPQLGTLFLLPGQVALVPAALAGGGLLGPPLRGLPRLCVIGRQRLGEVGQDAAEKLGLVGGLWGGLLRIGEEKMRFGLTMLRQELHGVRQFFGMRRALGTAMKALVEGVHQRLRLGLQRVRGRRRLHVHARAGRRLRLAGGRGCRVAGPRAGCRVVQGDAAPVAPGRRWRRVPPGRPPPWRHACAAASWPDCRVKAANSSRAFGPGV